MEEMTKKLVDKYEAELAAVREQLAQTIVQVRFHRSQQTLLEEVRCVGIAIIVL